MSGHTLAGHALAGLAPVRPKSDDDPVEDARESLVATLAWMTAATLGHPSPLPTENIPAPAESWRASAGTMTPTGGGTGDSIRTDGRVVAEVQTEALGAIRLVVERTKTGLSVVVGLRGDSSATVTEAHRAGLEQALTAAGLSVASVTFVRLDEDGTAFALHDQGSEEAPRGAATSGVDGEDSRARGSGKRKINTLG
jgi:hypothetical protein